MSRENVDWCSGRGRRSCGGSPSQWWSWWASCCRGSGPHRGRPEGVSARRLDDADRSAGVVRRPAAAHRDAVHLPGVRRAGDDPVRGADLAARIRRLDRRLRGRADRDLAALPALVHHETASPGPGNAGGRVAAAGAGPRDLVLRSDQSDPLRGHLYDLLDGKQHPGSGSGSRPASSSRRWCSSACCSSPGSAGRSRTPRRRSWARSCSASWSPRARRCTTGPTCWARRPGSADWRTRATNPGTVS